MFTAISAVEVPTVGRFFLPERIVPCNGYADHYPFDSRIIRPTLLQAAVDQKSIKAVTDTTLGTYSDDYTLAHIHTVPPAELEALVNDLPVQQASMILGPVPRIICFDLVDIHYHGCPHADAGELCNTKPRDGTSQYHRYLAGFVLCRDKPLVVAVTPIRGDESKRGAVLPFDNEFRELILMYIIHIGLRSVIR